MLRLAALFALLIPLQGVFSIDVEAAPASPTEVVLPDFSGMTVAAAQAWVLDAGLGGLLIAEGDEQPHVPGQIEMTLIVLLNARLFQPGTSIHLGEWVGVEVLQI